MDGFSRTYAPDVHLPLNARAIPTPQPQEFEERTRETPGRRMFEDWLKKKANTAIDAAIGGEDERVRSVNSGKAQVWRELVSLFCER